MKDTSPATTLRTTAKARLRAILALFNRQRKRNVRRVTLHPDSLNKWTNEDLEHLRYEYRVPEGAKVYDIGACKGDWYEMAQRVWPQAVFTLFEPTDHLHDIQVRPQDSAIKAAAWIKDGIIEMGGSFFATSVYEPEKKQYPCVDITKYCQDEITLMKINIEGAEWELVPYLIETGAMKNIDNLQVQCHLVEGLDTGMIYKSIREKLSETHYLTYDYPY